MNCLILICNLYKQTVLKEQYLVFTDILLACECVYLHICIIRNKIVHQSAK
ncbi:hypothetical protein DCAR_0206841 [Daucus carota subsp. sativus]|uniref:Uncharacterized protein n=1 Tax=Daucus carota subsp. sativus TaxID=79200 RepID=A0AAF0WF48_DAUCS|nr:hypothetical protein DCAR_0206841 [Daucus carota subsp. sativus]